MLRNLPHRAREKSSSIADQERARHTVTLHDAQELDDDLGAGPDHDLALSGLLGVVDGIERIVEDGCLGHFCE